MKSIQNQALTEGSKSSDVLQQPSSSSQEGSTLSVKPVSKLLITLMQHLQDSLSDKDFSGNMAVCLFMVAASDANNPLGVLELGKQLDMSAASTSRMVAALGRGLRDKEGLGLIEATEDPSNWSRKLVRITPKGIRLVESLGDRLIAGMRRM